MQTETPTETQTETCPMAERSKTNLARFNLEKAMTHLENSARLRAKRDQVIAKSENAGMFEKASLITEGVTIAMQVEQEVFLAVGLLCATVATVALNQDGGADEQTKH